MTSGLGSVEFGRSRAAENLVPRTFPALAGPSCTRLSLLGEKGLLCQLPFIASKPSAADAAGEFVPRTSSAFAIHDGRDHSCPVLIAESDRPTATSAQRL